MTITTTMRATATRPALRITRPDHRGFCAVAILHADGTVEEIGSVTRSAIGGWRSARGGRLYRTVRAAAEAQYADVRFLRDVSVSPLNSQAS